MSDGDAEKRRYDAGQGGLLAAAGNFSERQPCYHVIVNETTEANTWSVWVTDAQEDERFSFTVNDTDSVWLRTHDSEFALELLDRFKYSGSSGAKAWVDNGCP